MIKLAQGRFGLLAALVGVSLSLAALAAGAAYGIQLGVDALVSNQLIGVKAMGLAAVFVILACAGAALEIYRAWAAERLGLSYVADVRAQLFERLVRASPTVLAQRGQGGLLLPFVGDLTALKKWISDGLVRLISAAASSILLLAALAFQSPNLSLAAAITVAVAACAVLMLSGPLNEAIKETRFRRGVVASFVSRSIRAAGSIRAFNRFRRESKRLARRNEALSNAGLRLARISGAMTAIVHVAALILIVAALGIGAVEVRAGQLSIGGVVAAISVSGLLAGAVRDLGIAFDLWRRASVSVSKIERVLGAELAVSPPRAKRLPREASGALISLRGVSVEGILEDVSVDVADGEVVNLVGESGAGKSTLLAIAARLREPDRGRIRLLGRDARDLEVAALRSAIGFAGAVTPLLVGSIAMNLRYRVPSASDEEVARTMEDCGLTAILRRLPEGQAFRLSEGAPELSAGERQRLQLARAMLGQPPILVLDDMDAYLDEENASRIASSLSHYPGVVLMTATSPSWRRIATSTWLVGDGCVRVSAGPRTQFELINGGEAGSRRGGEL